MTVRRFVRIAKEWAPVILMAIPVWIAWGSVSYVAYHFIVKYW